VYARRPEDRRALGSAEDGQMERLGRRDTGATCRFKCRSHAPSCAAALFDRQGPFHARLAVTGDLQKMVYFPALSSTLVEVSLSVMVFVSASFFPLESSIATLRGVEEGFLKSIVSSPALPVADIAVNISSPLGLVSNLIVHPPPPSLAPAVPVAGEAASEIV
jgi:hypothetical protein